MRRFFFAVLTALMLATAVPAAAITYGRLDGPDHPMVGLIVFYKADGNFLWRCSGTLLSSRVVLTAGHCTGSDPTEGTPASARVYFDTSVPVGNGLPCNAGGLGYPCAGGITATLRVNTAFVGLVLPNSNDVSAVVLDSDHTLSQYGTLPDLHALDTLATRRGLQDTSLVVVGYGLLSQNGAGANAGGTVRARKEASQQIKDLRSALTDGYNIGTTNAPGFGTGDGSIAPGGTCFGDSGGPVFLSGTFTVVGITSFGLNNNCKGGDYAFRTDIEETQTFIASVH